MCSVFRRSKLTTGLQILVFLSVLGVLAPNVAAQLRSPASPQTRQPGSDGQVWRRYEPGNFGLSLELPAEPRPYDLSNQPDPGEDVEDFKMLVSTGANCVVLISHFYAPKGVSLKEFADGIVQGITGTDGVTDLQYSLDPATATRVSISGSYKLRGTPVVFDGFAFAKRNDIYMVLPQWPESQVSGGAAAKRIRDSVQTESQ